MLDDRPFGLEVEVAGHAIRYGFTHLPAAGIV
jgi:hypothetical protein